MEETAARINGMIDIAKENLKLEKSIPFDCVVIFWNNKIVSESDVKLLLTQKEIEIKAAY